MRVACLALVSMTSCVCGFADGYSPPICRDYVQCFESTRGTDAGVRTVYGEQGSCFVTSSTGEPCFSECRDKLAMLVAEHPDAGCKPP
jgi:hypothetical protein